MKYTKEIAKSYPESRVVTTCTVHGETDAVYFQKSLNFPFHLYSMGIGQTPKKDAIEYNNFAIAHLEYVIAGKGYIEDKDKTITVNAGDCFILPQNKIHHYYADKKQPWGKIWLNFSGSLSKTVMEKYGINGICHIKNLNIYDEMQEMFSILKQVDKDDLEISNEIFILFCKVIQKISAHITTPQQLNTASIADITKRTIDMNQFHSLDDIAKFTSYSKAQIIRSFKDKYGVTPYQYALSEKLKQAKQYLENSNISIASLSLLLNFSSPNHFSSFFKRETGLTPAQYRREHAKK
ncbi:MAG: helix-turn-helix domain-containing protein [Clostridia bacterium]|nr:helix-turn-helix domain-containing protein [Clostridia bacterium]